jgi:hypothetical protein
MTSEMLYDGREDRISPEFITMQATRNKATLHMTDEDTERI